MRPPGSRLRPGAVFFMLLAVALTALGVGLAMVDQVGEAIIGKRQREVAEAARDYFVAFAHEEGIALFKAYSENGDNDQLKAFAQKGLPVLQKHLEMAQKIAGNAAQTQ